MDSARLDELFDRYVDNDLGPAEQSELAALLGNPEHQHRWRLLASLDGKLQEEHLTAPAEAPSDPRRDSSSVLRSLGRRRPGRRVRGRAADGSRTAWIGFCVAAAAAIAFALALLTSGTNPPPPPPPTVAAGPPAAPADAEPERSEPPRAVDPAPSPPPVRPEAGKRPPTPPSPSGRSRPSPDVLPKDPPAVRPAPPAPVVPRPPTKAMKRVLARLRSVSGDVRVGARPGRAGDPVAPGEGVAAVGPDSTAVIEFPDGTRITLNGESEVGDLQDAAPLRGKRVVVRKGSVDANVARQPRGRRMVFHTAHGDAEVVGTRLRLIVGDAETRLEVTEGRVRLKRLGDGKSVLVGAGYYAVAAPASDLEARPLETVDLVRVSFGPATAPVPAGFTGFHGQAFDPATGMGWREEKRAASTRLRATGKDLLHRRMIFAGSERRQEHWEIAVREGTYYVTVSCGDPENQQGPNRVLLEGRPVIRDVMTAPGEFAIAEDVPVRVRDGKLTVTVGALGAREFDADATADSALNYVIIRRAK